MKATASILTSVNLCLCYFRFCFFRWFAFLQPFEPFPPPSPFRMGSLLSIGKFHFPPHLREADEVESLDGFAVAENENGLFVQEKGGSISFLPNGPSNSQFHTVEPTEDSFHIVASDPS